MALFKGQPHDPPYPSQKKITHQHSRVIKLWLMLVGAKQVLRAVLG